VERNPALAPYRKRVIAVTGDDDLEEIKRQEAIYGFAPISTEAPPGRDADLYDILITTDVLAEGVNLQQCRNIINLDVPWNPMRLVQRHGRIDRIGSQHPRVFLRTIFPAERLDQLLNLEQRILAKIAMAAASIRVASPVDGAAHGQQVFTETREEFERLLKEDPTLYERGGTASAARQARNIVKPFARRWPKTASASSQWRGRPVQEWPRARTGGFFSVPPWGTALIYVSCPLMTHGAPEELKMRLSANSVRVSEADVDATQRLRGRK
jgi:superfamily II DNA/RNA helicase